MAWALIQHVAFEGPGLIAAEASARGIELDPCHGYRGHEIPNAGGIDGLVVMGGPMGVSDADGSEHGYLADEIELIESAADDGKPTLGVCLGSQLLAAALGAEVHRGPAEEIGLGSVDLTADGRDDPVLGPAGPAVPVFHWHGDSFDIPSGALRLAGNGAYANQAFRFGELAYGFQFHVEVDRELAEGWREHLPAGLDVDEAGRGRVERSGRAILSRFFDLAVSGRRGRAGR